MRATPTVSALESEARALLEQTEALQRAAQRVMAQRQSLGVQQHAHGYSDSESPQDPEGYCPVSWMLQDLVNMVASSPSVPVSHLEEHIRMRISEQSFCGEGGDVAFDSHIPDSMEAQVTALVEVLEKLRTSAISKGMLCSHPAAIPQCG